MMRFLSASILALSACVAGSGQRALSVQEVVKQARALDGQEVIVRGWIEQCDRLSCVLYASAGEVRRDEAYFLSVGPSGWFDAFAARNAPTPVTLRARLHDRCIIDPATDVIPLCTDRSNTLEPIAVVR